MRRDDSRLRRKRGFRVPFCRSERSPDGGEQQIQGETSAIAEKSTTVLISSHILGELSKMATHYGIIKDGTMVKEISADDLSRESKDYLNVACDNPQKAFAVITEKLHLNVEIIGNELHILDFKDGGAINMLLSQNGVVVSEMKFH